MNCQEVWERLAGRVVDALPAGEADDFDRHVEGCANCRERLTEAEMRLGRLGEYFEAPPPPRLAEQTMARIREEAQKEPLGRWQRWGLEIDNALQRFASQKPTSMTALLTSMVAGMLMVSVLSPNMLRGRSSGSLIGCQSNLRVLSRALDHYAQGHHGHYPPMLGSLNADYLRTVPECPSAGIDTYTRGYEVSADEMHYTLSCHGLNHADARQAADEPEVHK